MKIIVTGASGFLGSRLAIEILERGHDGFLLLRPGSKLDRLGDKAESFKLRRYETDVDISGFVTEVSPDLVIHTACSYGRKDETPLQIYDANLRFGLSLLQAIEQSKRVVTFINSGTVLQSDTNLYALTKNQFSQAGRALATHSKNQLRFINVALQHMYGPGDDPSKLTTHVLRACRSNTPEIALTAGEQKRDLIYIDDVISAFVVLAEKHDQLGTVEDFDVGSGVAPTIRAFVETVHRMTKSSTKLRFGALPYREKEAMLCVADTTRMRSLGWAPQYDIEAGIRKTLQLECRT